MMEMGGQYGLPDYPISSSDCTSSMTLHQNNHHRILVMGGGVEMGLSMPPRPPPPPPPTNTTTATTATKNLDAFALFAEEAGTASGGGSGGNGFQGRWPRQETLTLLEVRTRLDSMFREAVHKAPLWEEVSRIMAEEHGYQRSAKKCREKVENLYKYYKKTKEGKAGRQDGKQYRFFMQLEALYGENRNPTTDNNVVTNNSSIQINNTTTTNTQANSQICGRQLEAIYRGIRNPINDKNVVRNNSFVQINNTTKAQVSSPLCEFCEGLSFSNSTEFDSSSTNEDDNDEEAEEEDLSTMATLQSDEMSGEKLVGRSLTRSRKSKRMKMIEFVDLQLRSFMEVQEAWFDKMLKALEQTEEKRISREEAWRRQEAERLDREHRFWACERAWIEARDAALIEALDRISRSKSIPLSLEELKCTDARRNCNYHEESETLQNDLRTKEWTESEITNLIIFE